MAVWRLDHTEGKHHGRTAMTEQNVGTRVSSNSSNFLVSILEVLKKALNECKLFTSQCHRAVVSESQAEDRADFRNYGTLSAEWKLFIPY